jgi:hypothetical protein
MHETQFLVITTINGSILTASDDEVDVKYM